jgi:phage shock protein A
MGCKPCKNNILRVHYRALIAAGTSLANMVARLTPSQEKIQWYKTTLSRISDIVRSNVNELLDQMEDPEKMVRQMVRDMESEVDRVTSAVGTAVAGVRRNQKEQESQRQRSTRLQAHAAQALEAGEEELTRQILGRRVLLDHSADDLSPVLEEGQQTVERLKAQLTTLRADLEDARQRQGSMIARIRAAKGSGSSVSVGNGSSDVDPFSYIRRLELRLEHNRGQFDRLRERLDLSDLAQEAADEARHELGEDTVIGKRFAELDVRQKVDTELAALRGDGTKAEKK